MLEKMKDLMGQYEMMQGLWADENFKTLMSNPKVHELFKDDTFLDLVKAKDFSKIIMHSKFISLMADPELATLMAKINFKDMMGK